MRTGEGGREEMLSKAKAGAFLWWRNCSPQMGRARLCAGQESGQSPLLLLAGQGVLVALPGKKG